MVVPNELPPGEADRAATVPTAQPWVEGSGEDVEPVVDLADSTAAPPGAGAAPDRTIERDPPPAAASPPRRRRFRRLVRLAWGCLLVAVSLVPLGAWAAHVFLPGQLEWVPRAPHYWGIPARLWSTVLLTLFLGLAIEGLLSIAREE